MSRTVYLPSGTERWTVVSYKPCNIQIYVTTVKFLLSFQQNIDLYYIVYLAATAIATATTTIIIIIIITATTTYLLCKPSSNQCLAKLSKFRSHVNQGRSW